MAKSVNRVSTAAKDIPNTNMTGPHYSTGNGKVNIDIAGNIPVVQYGRISVKGPATISPTSTLNVTLSGGFVPSAGQKFEIIVVNGTLTGDFGTKNLPLIPGAHFHTTTVTQDAWRKYTLTVVCGTVSG